MSFRLGTHIDLGTDHLIFWGGVRGWGCVILGETVFFLLLENQAIFSAG